MNTSLPIFHLHPPQPHCEAVSPLLPHNSCSSASTTVPYLVDPPLASGHCPLPLLPIFCWLLFCCCCRQRCCCSSATDRSCLSTAPLLFIRCLLPAVVVLRLCHHTYVDFCFVVIVLSAVIAPPPQTIVACSLPCRCCVSLCRILSATVFLHLILLLSLIRHCALVDCCLPSVVVALSCCLPFCCGCWGGQLVAGVTHLQTCR